MLAKELYEERQRVIKATLARIGQLVDEHRAKVGEQPGYEHIGDLGFVVNHLNRIVEFLEGEEEPTQ